MWRVRKIASSADLFGLYANCSGSSESERKEVIKVLTHHSKLVELSATG